MSSIDGLSTGLDTSQIINQLMQLERRPQLALSARRDQEQAARTELGEIRTELTALRNQAADLRLGSGFERLTATSSNPDAVSVQASSSATTGSYTFEVTQTAKAASVYSDQVYASLDLRHRGSRRQVVRAPAATRPSASRPSRGTTASPTDRSPSR